MKIMSRSEALKTGAHRYFTGRPCKHGHIAERLTSNGSCQECTGYKGNAYEKHTRVSIDGVGLAPNTVIDTNTFKQIDDYNTEVDQYMLVKYGIRVHRTLNKHTNCGRKYGDRMIYDEKTRTAWNPESGKVVSYGEKE